MTRLVMFHHPRHLGRISPQRVDRFIRKRYASSSFPKDPPKNFFQRAWHAYSEALYQNPLTTKASMAAVIFYASDSATQYIMRNPEEDFLAQYQITRALSGSAFGILATGYLHVWWGFLEKVVAARLPVKQYRLSNTITKVVIDQALAAPIYIYSYYVVTNFIQALSMPGPSKEHKSVYELWVEKNQKASEMLWPTMLRHWRLWPAVHTFNFYYVPLHHRVLVQNLVLVGWSGYLSHLNSGGLMTPSEEIEVTEEVLHDPSKDVTPATVLVRRITTRIQRRDSSAQK